MKTKNSNDVTDVAHSTKEHSENIAVSAAEQTQRNTHEEKTRLTRRFLSRVRKAGERLYRFETACDDELEYFRKDVEEMVSAAILVGDLIIRRVHQGTLRMRGKGRVCGVMAVDRRFEHHVENVVENLSTGTFSGAVEFVQRRQRRITAFMDRMSLRSHRMTKKVEACIDACIDRFLTNRKRWVATMATAMGCFMMFCVTVNAGTVYNYYYHGTEIGTVKDKTEVEAAVEQVKTEVTEDLNVDVSVNAEPDVDITYEKEFSFSAVVDSAQEVASKLVSSEELEGTGYAIEVNGQVAALVDTEETADKIIQTVKENYCTVEKEEAEETPAQLADTQTEAASDFDAAVMRNIILAESMNPQTGVVNDSVSVASTEEGVLDAVPSEEDFIDDTYKDIDLPEADAEALEGITIDNVTIVDEVTVEQVTAKVSEFLDYDQAIDLFVDENGESKIFNISTAELEVYEEPISYTTVYEETDSLFEGESEVKTTGVDGTMQVIAKITKLNGEETEREVLNQDVLIEPVSEVVLKGTQVKPSWYPTGTFIMPASGKFSSGFGKRWGRNHEGIDIAGSYGSDIVAADGGTVIYAGYNSGGYGYLVKIDHGNGYVTYYGHNSKLCVSVGDKVAQGEVIAKMGSTGRSTGNHCHFEIRENGTPVNPLNYLS